MAQVQFDSILLQDQQLQANQSLRSSNGIYQLIMQGDGNLVLYGFDLPFTQIGQKALWSTNTHGNQGSRIILQGDGNFVIYNVNNNPIFSTQTNGKAPQPYHCIIQDDGNVVLYSNFKNPLWSSNTAGLFIPSLKAPLYDTIKESQQLNAGEQIWSENGFYRFIVQNDGNLVNYETNAPFTNLFGENVIWASNTNITNNAQGWRLVMQNDANLVFYSNTNSPIWLSNTYAKGSGPYRLIIQNDANLVIYDSQNKPIWAVGSVDSTPSIQKYLFKNPSQKSQITNDQQILSGKSIWSENGIYQFILSFDNNLLIQKSSTPFLQFNQQIIWTSNTNGQGQGFAKLILQGDGNLVLYSNNVPLWDSKSNGKGQTPFRLVMQNDGNLVLYDQKNSALWVSNTNGL